MAETQAGGQIRYIGLCDPKFRSCLLNLRFFVPRDAVTAPVHALLPDLLTVSSQAYPTASAMTLRLESLYAAEWNAKLTLCGDDSVLEFTASWLDDRYALGGEPLTDEVLRLIFDSLLHPNAENGAFCEPEFRIAKQNLLDDIDCEQNDRRAYTIRRGTELAFAGEPAAIPAQGSRNFAEAVTPEQAYQVWQDILHHAEIMAVSVTPEPKPQIEAQLAAALASIPRPDAQHRFYAPSPVKSAPVMQTESLAAGQTKLVLTYKYDSIPREILLIICGILGWIQDSLLFMNLRERQTLCYYCCLQCADDKHALFIDSGIAAKDIDAVCQGVEAQLAALRRGDFTDDMIEKAILRHACRKAAAADSPYDAANEPFIRYLTGDPRSPQEMLDAMRQVSRQQIADAAAQLRLDSGFILRAEREEAEEDAP